MTTVKNHFIAFDPDEQNPKVAILIHNRRDTGPYHKVIELAQAVSVAGARVTVICTSPAARLYKRERLAEMVAIIEMPDLFWGRLRQGLDPWNTLRRTFWILWNRPHVVHAIDCRPTVILPAMALRAVGAGLVISWWDLLGRGRDRSGPVYAATLGWFESAFEQRFRKYADRATVITRYLGDKLAAMGYPKERITIQRLGCDTKRFKQTASTAARHQLGLPIDMTVLCYVGALFPADRELLLKALRIVNSRQESALVTLLVGSSPIPEEVAKELNIIQVAHQTPEGVHRYLAAADLCLLPGGTTVSNQARWPSKCGDYFSAGRPLVASPISDFPELFTRHNLGYLAADGTAEAFANAILTALQRRDEWPLIGAGCRRFAQTELDTTALGNQLLTIYRSAMAQARNR